MWLTEFAAVQAGVDCESKGRARPEMSWKHRTPGMRIGFTALVLVGMICTLLIVVARLR